MNQDEQDAQELLPHSKLCTERLQRARVIHDQVICSCPARKRREAFLFLIKKARRQSYADAYAKIRYQARSRAQQAKTPQEKAAFEEVAAWAESLEFGSLEE